MPPKGASKKRAADSTDTKSFPPAKKEKTLPSTVTDAVGSQVTSITTAAKEPALRTGLIFHTDAADYVCSASKPKSTHAGKADSSLVSTFLYESEKGWFEAVLDKAEVEPLPETSEGENVVTKNATEHKLREPLTIDNIELVSVERPLRNAKTTKTGNDDKATTSTLRVTFKGKAPVDFYAIKGAYDDDGNFSTDETHIPVSVIVKRAKVAA